MKQKKMKLFLCLALIFSVLPASGALAEYVKNADHYTVPSQKVPENILMKIKENAEKRYPENDQLAKNTLDTQTRAYFQVLKYKHDKIPAQELVMIKRNAEREFPYDYVRQLVGIDKRVKTYLKENKVEAVAANQ